MAHGLSCVCVCVCLSVGMAVHSLRVPRESGSGSCRVYRYPRKEDHADRTQEETPSSAPHASKFYLGCLWRKHYCDFTVVRVFFGEIHHFYFSTHNRDFGWFSNRESVAKLEFGNMATCEDRA